ncbi:MAG: hypothetical protein AAGK23_01175 [Pseudomonadota bacterium]
MPSDSQLVFRALFLVPIGALVIAFLRQVEQGRPAQERCLGARGPKGMLQTVVDDAAHTETNFRIPSCAGSLYQRRFAIG